MNVQIIAENFWRQDIPRNSDEAKEKLSKLKKDMQNIVVPLCCNHPSPNYYSYLRQLINIDYSLKIKQYIKAFSQIQHMFRTELAERPTIWYNLLEILERHEELNVFSSTTKDMNNCINTGNEMPFLAESYAKCLYNSATQIPKIKVKLHKRQYKSYSSRNEELKSLQREINSLENIKQHKIQELKQLSKNYNISI